MLRDYNINFEIFTKHEQAARKSFPADFVNKENILKLAKEAQVPKENFEYLSEFLDYADVKNVPYGEKSPEEILRFSLDALEFLVSEGADAVVVACNTATSVAVAFFRFSSPRWPTVYTKISPHILRRAGRGKSMLPGEKHEKLDTVRHLRRKNSDFCQKCGVF